MEAGLRTYDLDSPYPEEFNRQAVGVLAKYKDLNKAEQEALKKIPGVLSVTPAA